MTTIIKKNTKASEIKRLLARNKRKAKKPFNPEKHLGALKIQTDPLELQKEWRREWNRLSS